MLDLIDLQNLVHNFDMFVDMSMHNQYKLVRFDMILDNDLFFAMKHKYFCPHNHVQLLQMLHRVHLVVRLCHILLRHNDHVYMLHMKVYYL